MMDILKSDEILIIMYIVIFLLIIAVITLWAVIASLRKKYKNFMSKFEDGKTIEEGLENYIHRVDRVEKQNGEILDEIKAININVSSCIQRIGMVRYNAYNDAGNNLSFAVALLNEKNDGIILNGIYSREMSNIYAKDIKSGTSTYTLSNEEKEALKRALN
jgi:hypothetical protein